MDPADLPPDDAFVRTAIRGMQTPDHHEEFWSRVAGVLDQVDDGRPFDGADPIGAPGSLDALSNERPAARHTASRPARRASHPPRRAPLRAAPPPRTPALAGQVHIDAPTARVPAAAAAFAGASAGAAAGAAAVRKVADPLSKLRIEHDAATLPFSMRRTSNAVLLAVALAAVVVSVLAGLSLVRQRSESGAPTPVQQSAEVTEGVLEDLAA